MDLKINWDALGIFTSIACAIHCALLPVVLTSLPVFGVNIIHNNFFEWGMILLAFIVGVYSLFHGFFKHHRTYSSIVIFCTGFCFLVLKQFYPIYETWLLTAAVSLIITAHYYNYRLCTNATGTAHHNH